MWRKKRVMKGEELACSSPMSLFGTLDAAEKEYGDNGYSKYFFLSPDTIGQAKTDDVEVFNIPP